MTIGTERTQEEEKRAAKKERKFLVKMIKNNLELLKQTRLPTGEFLNDEHRQAMIHIAHAYELIEKSLKLAGEDN